MSGGINLGGPGLFGPVYLPTRPTFGTIIRHQSYRKVANQRCGWDDGIEISGEASSLALRLHVSSMARTFVQSTLGSFGPLSAASIRELCVRGYRESDYPDPEIREPLLGSMTGRNTSWLVTREEWLRTGPADTGNGSRVVCFSAIFAWLLRQPTITPIPARDGTSKAWPGASDRDPVVVCGPEGERFGGLQLRSWMLCDLMEFLLRLL